MVNTRRTPVTSSASSGLPQDPEIADLGTQVPVTTGLPMNTADMVNPVTITGTINLDTTVGKTDLSTLVDPSGTLVPPGLDPPLAPPTEGRTQRRQPFRITTRFELQFYDGGAGPGVGEPHLDLGEDLQVARLREVVGRPGLTKELGIPDCNSFAL
uniref:Uncharacterized protein n=1 Tax=Cannabis sativa TaxID=3483 RepID=A0A803P4W0_CANSA